ncbi:MAG: 50S ribosomal protein L24 [Coriobacteriales bacterium]|nr:50S ribosomal protein L24 [Coriobacteriales bacterium]MBQ6586032.1 50S ribosomal protein L24 [Coriobacteriales bacterium]
MTKLRIRKGDKVKVISGNNKGKVGTVLRCLPESERVVVEKVNIHKKAMRPTRENPRGGIMEIEAPLHVSNVMLVCPKCGQPTRVGLKRDDDGKRVRVCKKCGKDI